MSETKIKTQEIARNMKNRFIQVAFLAMSERAEKMGAEVRLVDKYTLGKGMGRAVGMFESDEVPMRLSVCSKYPESYWITAFVHEFSHLQQCTEQSLIWKKYAGLAVCEPHAYKDGWITRFKNMDPAVYKERVKESNILIRIEHDCEARTIANFHKYEIANQIDLPTYVRSSNAVLWKYAWLRDEGWWPKIPGVGGGMGNVPNGRGVLRSEKFNSESWKAFLSTFSSKKLDDVKKLTTARRIPAAIREFFEGHAIVMR